MNQDSNEEKRGIYKRLDEILGSSSYYDLSLLYTAIFSGSVNVVSRILPGSRLAKIYRRETFSENDLDKLAAIIHQSERIGKSDSEDCTESLDLVKQLYKYGQEIAESSLRNFKLLREENVHGNLQSKLRTVKEYLLERELGVLEAIISKEREVNIN